MTKDEKAAVAKFKSALRAHEVMHFDVTDKVIKALPKTVKATGSDGQDAVANLQTEANTYGSDESPFFRPPHGVHNPDIDQVAADAGYTTLTRWSADIGNSRPPCPQSPAATPSKADRRSSSSDTAAKRSASSR